MFPRWLVGMLAAILALFILMHVLFPTLAIDTTTLALIGMLIVVTLLPFSKSISLPGLGSITLRDVEPARAVVDRAIREVSVRDFATGRESVTIGRPTEQVPTWRMILNDDPNIALGGLG